MVPRSRGVVLFGLAGGAPAGAWGARARLDVTRRSLCRIIARRPPHRTAGSVALLLRAWKDSGKASEGVLAVDEQEQREIDALLARYERELEYFVLTRDRLLPLMRQLLDALREWARSGEDADGRAAMLRREYVAELNTLGGQIDDWVRIRGSGLRVSSLAGGMSDEQVERFSALQSREVAEAVGREEFDAAQAELRELLLIFEEFAG